MGITYFKRYTMRFDLRCRLPEEPSLPEHYQLLPWRDDLLNAHAEAKYKSFKNEMDANVFPCLAQRDGCISLMREISHRSGFVPEATWLAVRRHPASSRPTFCGTVQGINDEPGIGSIQNLGVVPEHRGLGLATALLHRAMVGFRSTGLPYAALEVTAKNDIAIQLYEQFGFRKVKTVFKSLDMASV